MKACNWPGRPWILIAATTVVLSAGRADLDAAPDAGKQVGTISVGVFVVPARGKMSQARQATLLLTMEAALQGDQRLVVVDKDLRLARRSGAVPVRAIVRARALLDRGTADLSAGRADAALPALRRGAATLAKSLAYASKKDLARAQFLIGATHVALGQNDRARRVFVGILAWRPEFVPADVSRDLSRQVGPVWNKAKASMARQKRGSLELVTEPAGALAYVDGNFLGFTPTSAEDLPAGTHYVTFRLNGFARTVIAKAVSGPGTETVKATLERSAGVDQVDALSRKVAIKLGRATSRDAVELGRILSIDHAVFVQVPEARAARAVYYGALYDTQTGKLLRMVKTRAGRDDMLEDVLGDLARSLYANLEFTAEPASPVISKKPARPAEKPFYKRWWFLTGVGVVAAAALAIPIAVVSASDSDSSCSDGAVCGEVVWSF
ncbi:MAG: PEGA domain-containing protein [Proteobacteria bacterium]|nr:PEGA domain-containing protein [Pseudomonadota bacterium]